jgi:thiol-disulfide isomerase/thioredoxin
MITIRRALVAAGLLLAVPVLFGQVKESQIEKRLGDLRDVPVDKRPAVTLKLAQDIQTLPGGKQKLNDADGLAHLATEGDAGQETLQAVADTLAQALTQWPVPAKGDQPPMPYMDLARLVRYEGVTTTFADPLYTKAAQILVANEADIQKADFTLPDMRNKKVTLSALRGKIVIVNFWATWCPPCRLEMPELDGFQTYFESQGLVVLAITDEEPMKVASYFGGNKYHPDVLFDNGGKVHRMFHVQGIPETFLFDRDGKLLAAAMDQRTRRQFLEMLSKTDLHAQPAKH